MKFVEYFRNLDSKKQTIIAGALVITLAGGSMALKVHHEKVNPSTSPVSAGEIDSKDKMISQLKTENKKLDAQKTKNKKSSNNVNLVPYNVDGSLGGGYNSTPLSLGGDYNYTPTLEPAVYEPIINAPTLEPVEDEIIKEFDKPMVEPINDKIVEPTVPIEQGITEVTVAPPTVPNEEGLEKDNSLAIIKSATYKGKKIVFFVEKYLQCEPTYDYLEEDNKQILTVNGNGLFIRFEKVSGGDYECTKITLNGQDRRDLLDTIFEINEGESDNSVVISPDQPPVIEVPDLNQPVEPEQPKDDKVETENNTGVTAPPVTPPPEIMPPLIPIPDVPNNGGGVSEEVIDKPIMVVPIEGRNVDDLVQEIKEKEFNGREDIRVEIVDDMIYFYEII